jgi:two-component system nitrogen regulation response regulator GlnG
MTEKDNKTLAYAIEDRLDRFFKMHEGDCPESGLYQRVLREVEKALIKGTLNHVDGVQIKASKILGINRNTLSKKIRELEIS